VTRSVAHLRRGRQELSAGHADAAEKEFRAVLAADPGSPAAHRGLAEIDRRQGKMDDAVRNCRPRWKLAIPPSFEPCWPKSTWR